MADEIIITMASFDRGADIYLGGKKVYRISPYAHAHDERERIINRDGIAVVQTEIREVRGNRSWPTDVWADVQALGPAEEIVVLDDHSPHCGCPDCE